MLASYFPKPANPMMGNWALSQAQAFVRGGLDVRVVSGTAWVPKVVGRAAGGAAAYSDCPASYTWGNVTVTYPRWAFYPLKPLRALLNSNPALILSPTWWSVRSHLLNTVRAFQPDVIYAHHTQVNGYLASRLHQITGVPYVITDHDFGEIEACRRLPARRRFFAPIVEAASAMVSVASRMENLMRELFPAANAVTVHNGSDPPPAAMFAVPRPPEIASKLILFCACAFYERKGIPLLVQAFARVADAFPNAILRIAGDGETRPAIEAAIQETGLSSRVQLLGRLPHDEVVQEMIWADLFVLPGWDEPFATAFTEALSAGCPIVYASDGGITDVLVNGVHGIAVEPRSEPSLIDALQALLTDEKLRNRMSDAALRLFREKLLWDRNAADMKSLFASAAHADTAHAASGA